MRRRHIKKTVHSSELEPEVVEAWLKLKNGSIVLYEGRQWKLMDHDDHHHFDASTPGSSYSFHLVR